LSFFEPFAKFGISYYLNRQLELFKQQGLLAAYKTKVRRRGKWHYRIEVSLDLTSMQAARVIRVIVQQIRVLGRWVDVWRKEGSLENNFWARTERAVDGCRERRCFQNASNDDEAGGRRQEVNAQQIPFRFFDSFSYLNLETFYSKGCKISAGDFYEVFNHPEG
jgi:hypothetical protein